MTEYKVAFPSHHFTGYALAACLRSLANQAEKERDQRVSGVKIDKATRSLVITFGKDDSDVGTGAGEKGTGSG